MWYLVNNSILFFLLNTNRGYLTASNQDVCGWISDKNWLESYRDSSINAQKLDYLLLHLKYVK